MEQLDEQGNPIVLSLERKSVQPYATQDEYLYAMKEDLAEWLNTLYALAITVDTFFEDLETGIVICEHANKTQDFIKDRVNNDPNLAQDLKQSIKLPEKAVQFKNNAQSGSFLARDNISNFIAWCKGLGIPEVLLFETEDLVNRKNERNVVLCLLEVARRGARYGMLAPQLIQLEEEIDAELAGEEPPSRLPVFTHLPAAPAPQRPAIPRERWVNEYKTLDEMVRDLVSRCTCPDEFPMIRVAEGKYKIGDSQTLIFVRILRNHVMVRIGGGWDTLENYLDRHDPCRCNTKGHKGKPGVQVKRRGSAPIAPGLTTMEVKTTKSTAQPTIPEVPQSPRRTSLATSQPSRQLPKTPDQPSRLLGKSKPSPNRNQNNNQPLPRRSSIATPGTGNRLHKTYSSSGSLTEEFQDNKTSIPKRPKSAAAHNRSFNNGPSRERSTSPSSSSGSFERGRSPSSPKPGRNIRSRSVGPTELKQSLASTAPASMMREAVRANRGQEEVLRIKRDGSGHHNVGPVVANGVASNGSNAMTRARMQITPDRLLPDKLSITRSPSMESDSSSSCISDRSGMRMRVGNRGIRTQSLDNDCLTESTPEEESPPEENGRKRTLSASFSIESSELDTMPEPEPNAELNQHMELLFEEYMKIERGSQSLRQTPERESAPPPARPKSAQPGVRKDLSKVKSRLADYISGKKDAPGSSNAPQPRKNSATTTPMGFKRPASASGATTPRRPSLAGSRSQSRENILDGSMSKRPSSRGASPAMPRRQLPATPKSMPVSPTTPMPRPRSAAPSSQRRDSSVSSRPTTTTNQTRTRPTTPSRGMVRSQSVGRVQLHKREQSRSREDLLDDAPRPRGRTPTQSQAPRPGAGGSAFKPVTPRGQAPQESTPTPRSRPRSAQSAFRKVQSRSKEDLLDGPTTGSQNVNTPAWRSKTPNPASSATSTFRAPSPGPRSAFRPPTKEPLTTTEELHNTIAEIADFVAKLPKDYDRPFDLDFENCKDKSKSPSVEAKPRKDKIGSSGPKTKIPMPVGAKERAQERDAFSPTLKRFDSGVDINITDSPTESSIHEEEEHLPWHQEQNGILYSTQRNQEQEYF